MWRTPLLARSVSVVSKSEAKAIDKKQVQDLGQDSPGPSAALVGFLLLAIAVGTVTLVLANTAGI